MMAPDVTSGSKRQEPRVTRVAWFQLDPGGGTVHRELSAGQPDRDIDAGTSVAGTGRTLPHP